MLGIDRTTDRPDRAGLSLDPDHDTFGDTRIVDPFGVTVAAVGTTEGIAVTDLSPDRVAQVRKAVPSLEHRR